MYLIRKRIACNKRDNKYSLSFCLDVSINGYLFVRVRCCFSFTFVTIAMHFMRFTELIASNANAVVCSPSTTTQSVVLHRFWCLIHFSLCFTAYYSLGHYIHTHRGVHTFTHSLTIYIVRLQKLILPFGVFSKQHRVYFFCFYRIRFWLFSLSHSLHRRFSFIVDLSGDLLGVFAIVSFSLVFFFLQQTNKIYFVAVCVREFVCSTHCFSNCLLCFTGFYVFSSSSWVLPRIENIHRLSFTRDWECERLSGFHLINILLFLSLDLVGPHKPNTLKRPFFGLIFWIFFSTCFFHANNRIHANKAHKHTTCYKLTNGNVFFFCPEQQECYSSDK